MEFTLLRILKGRLVYRRGDLSLFIKEPSSDLLFDSMEAYENAYHEAYANDLYIKEEIQEILFERNLWTPYDEQDLNKLKKDEEELKFQCFKNYMRKRELAGLKFAIKENERRYYSLLQKKHQLDHLSCSSVAEKARWDWIIKNSTYFSNGTPYDWEKVKVSTIVRFYEESYIPQADFRAVARMDSWRSMWTIAKKTGKLFDASATELNKDQITLCSYSIMYDNVYESSESPAEEIINDDYCLDGWFVDQKRKNEKYKKEQQIENTLSPKIAKAGEIFMVATNDEEMDSINSMNSYQSQMIKKQRLQTINSKGVVESDLDFSDVREDLTRQENSALIKHMKGI